MKLHRNCIFVKLDDKTVVFDHVNRKHYTPQNESASILLKLLAKNATGQANLNSNDIISQLLQTFQITQTDAKAALEDFLNDLRGYGLLEEDQPITYNPSHPTHTGKAQAHIIAGGTVITVGYQISWYRP
jgi:hypothetical protein